VSLLQAELRAQQQAVAERDQHAQDLLDVIHQQARAEIAAAPKSQGLGMFYPVRCRD
jgi:hypothetical protein